MQTSLASKPRVGKKRLADRIGVNTAPIVGADGFGADPKAKRPESAAAEPTASASAPTDANSVAQPRGREWTVTVALPGSIVDSAQTHELRSYLVGQVARACAIFNVDEIVLFATESDTPGGGGGRHGRRDGAEPDGAVERKGRSDGCVFMARLLQYIECPSYLRKHIFPHHPDLRCVGLLAPLEAPHHLRIDEESEYREAVVIEPGTAHSQGRGGPTAGADDAEASGSAATAAAATSTADGKRGPAMSSSVYTGLRKELKIGRQLPTGTRVTVCMPGAGTGAGAAGTMPGAAGGRVARVVPPREPREKAGLYWGYEVRVASSLAAVWAECPYPGGYDLSVGTSEHGSKALYAEGGAASFELPCFRHLLIVFGGFEGLEPAIADEDTLADCDEDAASLFDHYLNLCPGQGLRTIRTEEALLAGLAALKPYIARAAARGAE